MLVTIRLNPGKAEEMLALAHPYIDRSREEDGCLSFDLLQRFDDPNVYVFVERWVSQSAVEAHTSSAHEAVWRKVYEDCVADRSVEIIAAAHVKRL